MVYIPGGSFLMGSPDTEEGHQTNESPQHSVTVPTFFMGKYPITQAQWEAVADHLPQIHRKLNPKPSYFDGNHYPVESVSWHDAIEFCARLSKYGNREYSLPSEAQWEYACRAGTTTPFHFGETIGSDIANYYGEHSLGNKPYAQGQPGEFRNTTTPVGSFKVANAFGLYDMHGNIWEWCLDHWHENYEGAPSDGSAWLKLNVSDNSERVLHGGSWDDIPRYCRSASRRSYDADFRNGNFGFRVISRVRTLS